VHAQDRELGRGGGEDRQDERFERVGPDFWKSDPA